MKKLMLLLCLSSIAITTYGQLKFSLSYQHETTKAPYSTNSFLVNEETRQNGFGRTIQANVHWVLKPNISVFTGLGYSYKNFHPGILSFYDDIVIDESFPCGESASSQTLESHNFSNLELPIGVRLNTQSYKNFEIGLSLGATFVTLIQSNEIYRSNFDPSCVLTESEAAQRYTETNKWGLYGARIDVGIDIQYNINELWGVMAAGTWSPYDGRSAMTLSAAGYHEINGLKLLKNGQKGIQVGVVRKL